MLAAFTIRVPSEIDDEPWGSDDDEYGPPPPIPVLIRVENELSKSKIDQSNEGLR